jgi:lysophospholipase L1-like esterase
MVTRRSRPRAVLLSLALLWLPVAFTAAGCSETPTSPGPITPAPQPQPPSPPPPPPAPPPRIGVTRILSFGDSMTAGTTSPPLNALVFALDAGLPRSYPFKLQALMTARYTAQTIAVSNVGIAGRRAADDRDRFNAALSEARPEVVLLMEGANDLNAPFAAGEGVNDRIRLTVSAVEDMVRDAGFRGVPVMLATLPPQRAGGRSAGAAAFVARYNDALKAMAAAKGAQAVDVFAQFPLADIGEDGLHPTEAGYARLAAIWLDALKARYETAPPAGALRSAASAE